MIAICIVTDDRREERTHKHIQTIMNPNCDHIRWTIFRQFILKETLLFVAVCGKLSQYLSCVAFNDSSEHTQCRAYQ